MSTHPTVRCVLPLIAFSLFVPEADAQVTKPTEGKLRFATLDLQSGTIRRGPRIRDKGAPGYSTCVSFDNFDLSGACGTDLGPGGGGPAVWFDQFIKAAGKSQMVTGFKFAYHSAALDTSSGGPGGSVRISFWEGYTGQSSGVPTGTMVGDFCLTGLPAANACTAWNKSPASYQLEVKLGKIPICLPDGPVGYSWEFKDLGTDGVLAKTFPYLSCVQSCTGPGPDGNGQTDSLDRYLPPGTFDSTFGIPGPPFYSASIALELREAECIQPSTTVCNGTGINPLILSAPPGKEPRLGSLWGVELDCSAATINSTGIIALSFAPKITVIGPWGELLINPGAFCFIGPHGQGTVQCCTTLPKNLAHYGRCFTVQGFCGSSPTGFLSNALVQVIGKP